MATIIFSESSHANDSRIGKLETALKVFIEKEADEVSKKKDYENILFKKATSEHFAETYALSDGLGQWVAGPEGSTPFNDSYGETFKKIIEHNEFRKGFVITKKMLDDCSATQIGVEAGDIAKQFVDSYQETINTCLVTALAKGSIQPADLLNGKYINFNNGLIDVTTGDGESLFSASHKYGLNTLHGQGTQSNYFYVPNATCASWTAAANAGDVALLLDQLSVQMRNMKDENGNPMGYAYDTIIIPGDSFFLETLTRRALGSGYLPGTNLNDINTQYGNKNLIVLSEWRTANETNPYQFMLMSSEAKDKLHGNVFLQRTPMDVINDIDFDTRNWKWNGYARWGVGFGSYKHIAKCVLETTSDAALQAAATSTATI